MGKLAISGGKPLVEDLFPGWPIFGEEEKSELIEVLESRKWGRNSGEKNTQFEKMFSEFQSAKHVRTVCNGSVALRIALFALGVGPGDEVIVPSYTFVATATTVIEANAIPVFADIEKETLNISPSSVEELINESTKAIIPVHFGGASAEMDEIMKIAKKHGLYVLEDSAQAQGSIYKGKKLGTIGSAGTFSFQLSKNITSGEGGAITTMSDEIVEKIDLFYNCGRKPKSPWYIHYDMGGNYRLTEFQAGILIAQLKREEKNLSLRRKNAKILDKEIKKTEAFEPIVYEDYIKSSYYLYLIRLKDKKLLEIGKEKIVKALNAEGIPAMEGYPFPLYKQPMFKEMKFWKYGCPINCGYYKGKIKDYSKTYNPNSEDACKSVIWLPNFALMGNEDSTYKIVEALWKIIDNLNELR